VIAAKVIRLNTSVPIDWIHAVRQPGQAGRAVRPLRHRQQALARAAEREQDRADEEGQRVRAAADGVAVRRQRADHEAQRAKSEESTHRAGQHGVTAGAGL
jgi:hypothetical protein